MQKIKPHFWYDKEAKEASEFYVSLFKDSQVTNITTLKGTPSGDADSVSFKLAGQDFMAISAGPYFKINPSISLSVSCESEEECKRLWDALAEGGKVLMEYNSYPWAAKYGWVEDKYGLSWQLSYTENQAIGQKIIPSLLFTQDKVGMAKEAIALYTSIFPNSSTNMVMEYAENDGDTVGFIKYANFTLGGQTFVAMDSSGPHEFVFNEGVSLVVLCDTQEEIDFYWDKLSAVPESEQCGWLKDKFGVSWQITPKVMEDMMKNGSEEQIKRVTESFLQMKKFDIAKLQEVYEN